MAISRRELLRNAAAAAAALALPAPLRACAPDPGQRAARETAADTAGAALERSAGLAPPDPESLARLERWLAALREDGLASASRPLGSAAVHVGESAVGTPYEAFTLEEYLRAGGDPMRTEPLTLSLTRFDCVSLVEACLAIARQARGGPVAGDAAWDGFAREMERMRYRGGNREGYLSRLHYFSEWLDDNERRGLVRVMGPELGGEADRRPLRFMTEHRDAYPALASDAVYQQLQRLERSLDPQPRWVIPTARIPDVSDQLLTGDIVAFATALPGLDVTHAAFAYRDEAGVLRVLHAPLSGGEVEVTRSTLPEYVAAIKRSTGILVARPLPG